MNKDKFKDVLDNCPRIVPVFMVGENSNGLSVGEYVYWSWNGKLMSRHGEVIVDPNTLTFVGYSPIVSMDTEWPNVACVVEF